MVWYAHGFSSEQWVPEPAEDDVLMVSEAAVLGVACWWVALVAGWSGWLGGHGG